MKNAHFYKALLSLLFIQACSSTTTQKEIEKSPDYDAYLQLSQAEKLKPKNAMGSFEVADGLEVDLFASEPLLSNPTNIDVDAKGRVWVCESYNYGVPKEKRIEEGGKISILEDTDGDGIADKKKVFYQGDDVHLALGIAVLGNKVYVTRSPDLLVFTDEDGDDVPDKKEKLFTGMGGPGDHSAHALIFGPDGKFYFNMGNNGNQVKDKNGNLIKDKFGREIKANAGKYLGGMAFRCNPDGSELEVLGHNFRNNYELAVDSYGNVWQSDNDDDGNKSVRINYLLEHGNYGYLDEFTMESWYTPRTNMSEEIPEKHWHQHDPGVVPNLMITGAGSPAGITIYEGNLLPSVYQGQMIHTDAGPNVVRAYPVTKNGAGFNATTQLVFQSKFDQWCRPVDVAVAPDGSLLVADWYDPGVGGGAASDSEKGRIFRVRTGQKDYSVSNIDVSSIEGAIEALKSPNMSTRYEGWTALNNYGEKAENALFSLWEGDNPIFKARALWLLGKIDGKADFYIQEGLKDTNPDIRITAIRMARQSKVDFIPIVKKLANDPALEVKRELAIGLYPLSGGEAGNAWASLAIQYKTGDRWFLEALGIGAENNWDTAFSAWENKIGANWNTPEGRDIIWRSRANASIPYLGKIISNSATGETEIPRYFRSFDFHKGELKQEILLSLLSEENPQKKLIQSLVLQHVDPEKTTLTAELKQALESTLAEVKGTQEYINIVSRFQLLAKKQELLELAIQKSAEETGMEAVKLLLEPNSFNGSDLVKKRLVSNEADGMALIKSMEKLGNKESLDLISNIVMDENQPMPLRKEAVSALGKSWWGEEYLLNCVKQSEFEEQLKPAASSVLFNVYRASIQEETAKYLKRPGGAGGESLPPIRDLVASTGNITQGKEVFSKYCQACHMVKAEGTNFGPKLSEIGSKLSKEGLYRAIMFPNEGINYDYAGYTLTLKNGSKAMGIINSETPEFIELRQMGGIKNKYQLSEIEHKEINEQSLMPNLSAALSKEQLVNLVEYLAQLKKEES